MSRSSPASYIRKSDIFSRPACILDAEKSSKKRNFFVEILIFLLVFFVYNSISSVILVIPTLIYVFTSGIFDNIGTGSVDDITEKVSEAMQNMPDWYMMLTLFATITGIAAVIFYCRKVEKRSYFSMGFVKRRWFGEYAVGFFAGAAMFSIAILICILCGSLEIKGFAAVISPVSILLYLAAFIIQGLNEELLCRGYLMVSVSRGYSLPAAIFANSMLFAVLHLTNNGISTIAFVNLILFGVFASIYFIKRGSIWGIAAFHTVWNFIQGNIYGISVSGNNISSSLLVSEMSDNGNIIGGGAFGLEGGLAVTGVLLVGILILCLMKGVGSKTAPSVE